MVVRTTFGYVDPVVCRYLIVTHKNLANLAFSAARDDATQPRSSNKGWVASYAMILSGLLSTYDVFIPIAGSA